MSYILEALKKSEQERNAEKVPNLETHHQQAPMPKSSRINLVMLGIALLVINLAVAGYFIWQSVYGSPEHSAQLNPAQSSVPVSQTISEQPLTLVTNKPLSATKASATREVEEVQTAKPEVSQTLTETQTFSEPTQSTPTQAITLKPKVVSTKPLATNRGNQTLERSAVPAINELPLRLQEQIPAIEFTTHIFVKEGGSFVIINGKSLGDGMPVGQGLELVQIVSDGVILEFRGQRFFLGALANW